jgi:uncharacterized protein (UPF0261 family)
MPPSVYAIATMDTKGEEIAYVASCLRSTGVAVTTIDVGVHQPPSITPDVSRAEVAAARKSTWHVGAIANRADAIEAMGHALQAYLLERHARGEVLGVIGIGGSGGTALITPAMRALPIGLPKLMVSTMASGNTAPYVDCSDIAMLFSVVDVAGLNAISYRVLANAAHAMAGMVAHNAPQLPSRPTLGMTMFGVTTPCVTEVRQRLETAGYDCLVFHATGTGGRAMEKLVQSDFIHGVLDLTTTEVADQVVGGCFPSGAARFDVIGERQIPYVLSLGAVDMVNFGAKETVPAQFADRKLHIHNAHVTLMRTTPDENRLIARWIAAKLNRFHSPFVVLIPERGVSALDAPGQPFYDPQADAALFEELESQLQSSKSRRLLRVPLHINDPEFAAIAVREFQQLASDNTEQSL